MTHAREVMPIPKAVACSEGGARLIELGSCRTPRVDTAEALRERIERNLHDGMQQRLVSLSSGSGCSMRSYRRTLMQRNGW